MRQARILEIVRQRPVSSQDELSTILAPSDLRVTQATLSRDIRELGLVKVRGVYRGAGTWDQIPDQDALRQALRQYVLQSGVSGNILMIRTAPGNAHAVGVVLDSARWPEVMGTVAGDDTIFALLKNARLGKKIMKRMGEYLA
jgi:transcriptional regulator of arginine metabolism